MRTNKDIWIDGTHARTLGARVLKVSEYQPAQKIRDDHAIPGRDAFVSIWDGAYDAVTYTIRFEVEIETVQRLLNAKKIKIGKVMNAEFSVIKAESEKMEYVRGGWRWIDVTYTCDPRAMLNGEQVVL